MTEQKMFDGGKAALAASGVGQWQWNTSTNEFIMDATTQALLGHSGGVASVALIEEISHPDDQPAVRDLMQSVAENPEKYGKAGSIQVQHRVRGPAGERWVQIDAATWKEDDVYFVGGTLKDVSDMRESMDQLRVRENQYRLYTALASDYVYEVDPSVDEPAPSIVAGSFEQTTGITVEQLTARGGWRGVIHEDDLPTIQQLAETLRAGEAAHAEYRIVSADGSIRWLRDRVSPVFEGTEVKKFIGSVQDITKQKRLEKQAAASEKNEALARFSASAARDFDNLLTVILGALELASSEDSDDSPEMQRHLLDTIRTAAEQASELTRNMLLYGQRISGRPTRIEVGTVVGMATAILRQGLGRQHMLNIEVRDTPVHVLIDPAQLQLMLLNLVVNARHAMPTGGQVTLTVAQQYFDDENAPPSDLTPGSFVSIEVHDNGVGIPPETLPHIFEPFFTTRTPGEGAGLGLAACKGIVAGAGGTITADSPEEGGAKFTIFLPVETPPTADHEEPKSRFDIVLGENESVLVVDDDPMLQRVFKRVLEEFGYSVATCGSGGEALEALEEEIFDIVVTDVVMPGIDGLELARTVRRRWQDIPVLLMSGKSHGSEEFEALTKPIRPRELALKIREVLDD